MPGIIEELAEAPSSLSSAPQAHFTILKQRVDLDFDFPKRSVKGSTEITVQPHIKELKEIRLHCRQCRPSGVQMGGINAKWEHDDAYRRSQISSNTTVHQHAMLKSKIEASLRPVQKPELVIAVPPKLKIQELQVDPVTTLPVYNGPTAVEDQEADALAIAENNALPNGQPQGPQFAPIKLTIDFTVDDFRDGIHWVGCSDGDRRYPYLYTKQDFMPGNTSCIFPCVDDLTSRCSWEVAITVPRTLGDAFKKPSKAGAPAPAPRSRDVEMAEGDDDQARAEKAKLEAEPYLIDLSADEAALELTVICVGEATSDVPDSEDDARHTVTFTLNDTVAARHVAFAIGPFEHVDLTMFRPIEEEEKLGTTAVKVDGYALSSQIAQLENTCVPVCMAIDYLGVTYGRFPFSSYQLLFVDDLVHDTTDAAGLSICSTRLLFPQEIIEPIDRNTRILSRAVTNQWSGVNIVPKELFDTWATSSISGYMTDMFIKKLCGKNEWAWRQKIAAEKVYELDVDRPSIYHLGALQYLDASIREFVDMKSALVLGILDRRLVKSSGSTGVMRILSKIFLNAKTGALVNGEISTQEFQRTCERLGHNNKLDAFFKQWVLGAGCPIFSVTQKFNKKKTVVEMVITQMQLERVTKPKFAPNNFMREIKEHVQEVWAPETQNVFTGPMTIRIHEADGTPYEHIVEIREAVTKLEIQYNTKYKRLKRSKRQKERQLAEGTTSGEGDDALLYCLGDILDTPQDLKDWKLAEWSAEDEEKMGQESYEWIRMDADFEWIGKIHLYMPPHMYISQLQQDRDLVAQYESMRFILGLAPHHVSLTLMVRTLMDSRYFHGIRVMAAEGIAMIAKDKEGSYQLSSIGQYQLEKAFSHLYCDEGSVMPRPNDFASRESYIIQCAIPRAMAMFRDADNRVPRALQQFFVDKLKFNDNSDNQYSDCHYVSTLMHCLADSLVVSHREVRPEYSFGFGDEDEAPELENPDAEFESIAVGEIERYRRIDEWVVTYQNIYSTTAIECLQKLAKAGVVKDKTKELFQYTSPTTAENVRLTAFRCMNEIGLSRKMPIMKHLIHSLADHHSPFFRDRMLRLLGEALGHLALDDIEVDAAPPPPPPPTDGLIVVEQEPGAGLAQLEAARRATPEGAIATLKSEFQGNEVFQQAVWYAATSPFFTLEEIGAFCDIAALMFDPVVSYMVTLKYPKPYRCQRVSKGLMRFYRGGAYRTAPATSEGLPLDDYLDLEKLGLKYRGPLHSDVKKYSTDKSKQSQTATLKLQIAQAQQQLQNVQAGDMPPPSASIQTPASEKSGFRLSLGGGTKRKMSIDPIQNDDVPLKALKLGKLSTPKNSASAQRKASVSASKPPPRKRALVVVRFRRESSRRKLREILSAPPSRSVNKSTPAASPAYQSQSRASSVSQQYSSSFQPPPSMFSPSSSYAAAPPPINLGSFRSYGATADSSNSASAAALSSSPTEVKRESIDSGTSASPPVDGGMLPPPKKKLTLKLGKKSQGSPE